MTRLLALSIVVGVVAWVVGRLARPATLDPDPMAQPDEYNEPVPMTWRADDGSQWTWTGFDWSQSNSATYLYNARTGVVTSYN